MLKKVLALTLALILCISGSVTGFAAETRDVIGTVDIENPVYEVGLPLDLNFKLDPLSLKQQNQIYSGATGFNIINMTVVPVLVDFDITITAQDRTQTATAGTTATFVDDPDDIDTSLRPDPNEKEIFLGVHAAKAIDLSQTWDATAKAFVSTPLDKDSDVTEVKAEYATAGVLGTNMIPMTDRTGSGDTTESRGVMASFLIDACDHKDTLEGDNAADDDEPTADSVASFRLFSKMTTYADWDATDLTVSGTIEFRGVAQDDFDKYSVDTNEMLDTTEAPRLMKVYSATPTEVGFINGGTNVVKPADADRYVHPATVSASALATTPLKIPFFADGADISDTNGIAVGAPADDKEGLVSAWNFSGDAIFSGNEVDVKIEGNYIVIGGTGWIAMMPSGSSVDRVIRLKLDNAEETRFEIALTIQN